MGWTSLAVLSSSVTLQNWGWQTLPAEEVTVNVFDFESDTTTLLEKVPANPRSLSP